MAAGWRHRMFPVGLYGVLLVGLFGVTFPELVAPAETVARSVVTLPLRAYGILLDGQPVLAADRPGAGPDWLAGEVRSLLRGAVGPPGHTPRVCRVLQRRVGPLGVVDELVLDVPAEELRAAAPLVTSGAGLLGFLHLPDEPAVTPRTRARVRLLPYRPRADERRRRALAARPPFRPARIAARVQCREVDARGELHFLVEPARGVDRWPLHCALLDDSYLGSRLRTSGELVTTAASDDPRLPAGLVVGRLRIWGYPEHNIPVGMFVEPVVDPRAVSAVVLWEPGDGGAQPPEQRSGQWVPVRFTRFAAPRPVFERWMVTSAATIALPDGAALVDGDRFLGRLRQPWSGQSLVSPFPASTGVWALLVRAADGQVTELLGRLVGRDDRGRLRLQVLAPEHGARLRGEVFTGANGPHCPAGFRIGTAEPGRWGTATPAAPHTVDGGRRREDHGELWLTVPEAPVRAPQVYVGPRIDVGGAR